MGWHQPTANHNKTISFSFSNQPPTHPSNHHSSSPGLGPCYYYYDKNMLGCRRAVKYLIFVRAGMGVGFCLYLCYARIWFRQKQKSSFTIPFPITHFILTTTPYRQKKKKKHKQNKHKQNKQKEHANKDGQRRTKTNRRAKKNNEKKGWVNRSNYLRNGEWRRQELGWP